MLEFIFDDNFLKLFYFLKIVFLITYYTIFYATLIKVLHENKKFFTFEKFLFVNFLIMKFLHLKCNNFHLI